MSTRLPRDIECPHCMAKVNHGCRSSKNPYYSAKTHVARWRAIGIRRPMALDMARDYEDGLERDIKIRMQVFADLRARMP